MDIVAHTLWAGAGMTLVGRRTAISRQTLALAMAMAALPDLLHLLPMIAWWIFADGSAAAVRAHAIPLPGRLPTLPATVALWSYHLHCVMHSAIVAVAATLLTWGLLRRLWLPLLGWWSHLVLDVFTHSAAFFPTPILYPFTERGFDGLAWNTPWFMALNYGALAAVGWWLLRSRSPAHG